jgi:hypothetical protein
MEQNRSIKGTGKPGESGMGLSFKDRFLGQAGALALAGMLCLSGGMALAEEESAVPVPDASAAHAALASFNACAFIDQIRNPRSPEQKRLAQWYADVSLSPTAKAILDKGLADGLRLCFDPSLVKVDECGSLMFGGYEYDADQINLNPDPGISPTFMKSVFVHEAFHKVQSMMAPTESERGNIPPWERIGYAWFREVGARVVQIIVAKEMMLHGQPDMMNYLDNEYHYRPIVEAFKMALSENPDDMKSALRAAAITALEKSSLFLSYAGDIMNWEAGNGIQFNPYAEAYTYMAESTLTALTETAVYGNYMDESLLAAIRGLFTEEDYRHLLNARTAAAHAPDGKADGVCVLKKDRVAAASTAPAL